MKDFKNAIGSQLPFPFNKPQSILIGIVALIVSGFFLQFGTTIFNWTYPQTVPYLPKVIQQLIYGLTYPFFTLRVSLLGSVTFLLLVYLLFKLINYFFLKKARDTIVFVDEFDFSNKGWVLNYWGSNDPDKTCHFDNSMLIFEALPNDLHNSKGENGAYYDLFQGMYEGSKYEISCWVRSEQNTTMGFKLWVHDTTGKNERKFPANFYTPGLAPEEIKVGFTGTKSDGLRIHLHTRAGSGRIVVDKVKVVKIK